MLRYWYESLLVHTGIEPVFRYEFFGNTLADAIFALLIFLVVFFALRMFRALVLRRLYARFQDRETRDFTGIIVEFIQTIPGYFYWALSLYLPLQYLVVNGWWGRGIDAVLFFVFLVEVLRFILKIVEFFAYRHMVENETISNGRTTYNLVMVTARIALIGVGMLLLLSNLGVEITPLLASLGVGGIAVAFALQNILSDVFSSFSIYFDRPFQVGDFVVVWGDSGTIKKIGVKSTHIKTLEGQLLVVSNQDMTSSRINNYAQLERRRVVQTFGIEYETPVETLRAIPDMIRDIIADIEHMTFDRAHFHGLGAYSLDFEVVYHIESSNYEMYMNARQAFNLALMETFGQQGINFAYPTQIEYRRGV